MKMPEWNSETAEWYASRYGDYPTNTLAIDHLSLSDGATIVDVGCGTGSALRHAATRVINGRFIGIDPVPRMLDIAREQTVGHPAAHQISYLEGSAESLPVPDACADFVLAFDSFDHWQDKARGLREIRRVLHPQGAFVVVKDGGIPDAAKARQAFVGALANAGLNIDSEEIIDGQGVSFTMWVCR